MPRHLILLSLLFTLGLPSHADNRFENGTYIVSGRVDIKDADDFVEARQKHPVTRVLFIRSPGGAAAAGQRLFNLIQGAGIDTYVEGHCGSACAIAFLGGNRRYFVNDEGTLFFHSPYLHGQTAPVETMKYAYIQYLEAVMNQAMPVAMRQIFEQAKDFKAGVLFLGKRHPKFVSGEFEQTQLCNGEEQNFPNDCKRVKDFDAYSLGLVHNQAQ